VPSLDKGTLFDEVSFSSPMTFGAVKLIYEGPVALENTNTVVDRLMDIKDMDKAVSYLKANKWESKAGDRPSADGTGEVPGQPESMEHPDGPCDC
jgi:hypothetical protein